MTSRFGPYPKRKSIKFPTEEVLVPVLRGEKGDKGDRGEQGVSVRGFQGEQGEPGLDGKAGREGSDGLDGQRGLKGDTGPRGIMGLKGIQGDTGPKGDKGDKGDRGEQGLQGEAGASGSGKFQSSGVGGGPVGVNVTGVTGRTKEFEFAGSGAPSVSYAKGTKKTTLTFTGGGVTDADYLVGTTHTGLSAEIVVGTSPGGELGGTWASPTVDATHSGSTHAATQAAAESTAASAAATHAAAADPHAGYRLESADHTHASTGMQGGQIAYSNITGTPPAAVLGSWGSRF